MEAEAAFLLARVSLDNYGSADVGPLHLSASVAFNDVFGQFETISLVAVTAPDAPQEMRLLQGSQDYPLGAGGLWLGYSLIWLANEPGDDLADVDLDLGTTIASAYLYYPFLRPPPGGLRRNQRPQRRRRYCEPAGGSRPHPLAAGRIPARPED